MKNNLVVKSNQLIEAKYELNLNEQKIILYAVSKLDREKENFNLLSLNIRKFTELLGTTQERYTEIREIVRELRGKEIIIKTEERELITGWLSSIEYLKDKGIIELEFSQKLIPYLLQLKSKFTRYQLENILNLKSKYSIRLYELMKQYESIGKREFKLKELKKILFVENQYERMYDLERFVLKPAEEEINKNTDIFINYEKIKTGRRITSFLFKIESKDQRKEIFTNDIQELRTKMNLKGSKFNDIQILDIYEKAVEKVGNKDIDIFGYIKLNYFHIKDKARNKYSYLLNALDNDYASAISQISLDYYIENEDS